MAYDGIFIKFQLKEIKSFVLDEHISKITQRSHKEVDFHIRKNNQNYILTLSANPNFPYILLSNNEAKNLPTPPSFCMLLRKYLQGAILKNIKQIGFKSINKVDDIYCLERVVKFEFENISESGDLSTYYIYFEIMGKYSNIIVTDENNIILDVLLKSSVANNRLVLKEKYSTKEITTKYDILRETFEGFISCLNEGMALSTINNEQFDLPGTISKKYAGLSKPLILHIILEYLNSKKKTVTPENFNYEVINKRIKTKDDYQNLFDFLTNYLQVLLSSGQINPVINYKSDKPSDFYIFKLFSFQGDIKNFDNINSCLENYIINKFDDLNDTAEKKNLQTIVKNLYNKLNKKLDIYKKDLAKCADTDKYKNYGELVSCFGYNLEDIKDGILTCKDYNHNDEIVKIPIDESLTVAQNVEKYYDKYNKLKRTKDNVEKLIEETTIKLEHLNSIELSLELPNDKNDIYLIKEEILKYFDEAQKIQSLKKQKSDNAARKSKKSNNKNLQKNRINYNIHHYKSSSGIDIYVGKNNLQNEYLTFTVANPDDTWLHIKNATGSHVIVKMPYEKLDDKTLVEAASLAAYFSEKRNETKATVDYTLRKELKKVKGKSPGFCIYHKNFSINVKPEILVSEI